MLDSRDRTLHPRAVNRAIESYRVGSVPHFPILLVLALTVPAFAGQPSDGLNDGAGGGYWLAQTEDLSVWWCESGWKVGRERGMPWISRAARPEPVAVSAARGEFEPAQVVLRPEREGEAGDGPRLARCNWYGLEAPISVEFTRSPMCRSPTRPIRPARRAGIPIRCRRCRCR
jgi:hypothetical protein